MRLFPFHEVDHHLCTGHGIAAGLVVIQVQPEVAGHLVQGIAAQPEGFLGQAQAAVVFQIRIAEVVLVQDAAQCADLEGSVMGDNDLVLEVLLQAGPKRLEILDPDSILIRDAMNAGVVARVVIGVRLDEQVIRFDDLPIAHYSDADGTNAAAFGVGGLEI